MDYPYADDPRSVIRIDIIPLVFCAQSATDDQIRRLNVFIEKNYKRITFRVIEVQIVFRKLENLEKVKNGKN